MMATVGEAMAEGVDRSAESWEASEEMGGQPSCFVSRCEVWSYSGP